MNTRTACTWFLFRWLTTGFFSCGRCSKKRARPGYKDELRDSWFPYENGQQLTFRNNYDKTETFTQENINTKAPYETSSGGYGSAPKCAAEKLFQSTEKESMGRSKASILRLSLESQKTDSFSFGRKDFNISLVGEACATVNTAIGNLVLEQRSAALLGNRTYANLLEATGDTGQVKITGVYHVYFAKGEDLVAFSEYPSLQTWVKQ